MIHVQVDKLWQGLTKEIVALIATYRAEMGDLSVSSKPDQTLLTDADVAVQSLIVQKIKEYDPTASIIAEEGNPVALDKARASDDIWIVDPIDGTAQFVEPNAVEFCSVIALYSGGLPRAALVVAPELGPERTPIVVSAETTQNVMAVNDQMVRSTPRGLTGYASTTRSVGKPAGPIEQRLFTMQYEIKTRTTSQTLDMVRTAFDLRPFSAHARPFDLFHRQQQKIWDGAAGICLALVAGLTITDEDGGELLPLPAELLADPSPVLSSTLVGQPALIDDILRT